MVPVDREVGKGLQFLLQRQTQKVYLRPSLSRGEEPSQCSEDISRGQIEGVRNGIRNSKAI